MAGRWGYREDGVHRVVKIHSFLNPCGVPYMALYSEDGYECGSLDLENHTPEEACRLLADNWEQNWQERVS